MAKVLAVVEQRDGKLKSSAKEVLNAASALAGGNAADVAAVVIGSGVEGLAGELKGLGADQVLVADHDALGQYNNLQYTAAAQKAVENFSPDVVVGIASPMGRDIFPRLAARVKGGLATDVTDVKLEGDTLKTVKPMYAGKCLANVDVTGGIKLATLRPNVFPTTESGSGAANVTKLEFAPVESRLKTVEIRKGKSEKPDLTEAALIISGGRAMANADNFKILHECADALGATVGASRAAVDSGYAPHDMQVGQTGKTVNPNLYIACGISGSIQHMAGMRTSKVIVAVNTDPEAPIFKIADYGIVADLFEAVPEMTKKFKEMLG